MPIISSNFKGNKWNRNKHLETIIPALFRKIDILYKRERVELPDGDFMDLDHVNNDSKNLLVLFHGLEGSSNSQYIKGFSKYFSNQGFDICAVNFRSCSGENNRLLKSYHSGKSDDVDLIINHIVTNKNYSKIILGGFSLGGNVLLKYLGEQAEKINPLIKTAFAF
jgi:predicted alpha/beta-fold hydrolase